MKRRHRFLVFLSFIATFLFTASVVLMYVFGYRFNFDRGIFIYSGSITIKPTPQTVTIKVDGEEIPANKAGILNQSYLISGLLPGKHDVEVNAPGYLPWTKEVIVRSGYSTEFWNVFLVQENVGKDILMESDYTQQVYPAPKSPTLLVMAKQKPEGAELILADTETGKQKQETLASFPGYSLLPESEKENIEWSANEKYLLAPLVKDGIRYSALINVDKHTSSFVSDFTQHDNLSLARWNPHAQNRFFYLSGHTLYQTDFTDKPGSSLYSFPDVQTYDLSGTSVYFLSSQNGIIYRAPMAGDADTKPEQMTTTALPVNKDHRYTLIMYDKDRFTVQDVTSGELWLYNRYQDDIFYDRILTAGAEGSQFSDDGKKLLYFTKNEAFIYYLRDWEVQPTRVRDSRQQILRLATDISFPRWSYDYEHVLFINDQTLKIIELDNREKQYLQNIVKFNAPLLQFLPRPAENKLYFIEDVDPQNRTVESIDFPPKTTNILGF